MRRREFLGSLAALGAHAAQLTNTKLVSDRLRLRYAARRRRYHLVRTYSKTSVQSCASPT